MKATSVVDGYNISPDPSYEQAFPPTLPLFFFLFPFISPFLISFSHPSLPFQLLSWAACGLILVLLLARVGGSSGSWDLYQPQDRESSPSCIRFLSQIDGDSTNELIFVSSTKAALIAAAFEFCHTIYCHPYPSLRGERGITS